MNVTLCNMVMIEESHRVRPCTTCLEEIMIEQVGEILLTDQFWDCNCKEDYIHPRNEEECQVCHCHRDEQPDARVEEVLTNLGPAGKLWESKMNVTLCNMVTE